VALDGRLLDLTYMEYELLRLLIGHPGRVYKREEILSQVWGYDYFGGMRTVDVHVRRVRVKLGQDHAWLIETVRGVGYRLAQLRP
jgi:DNA-binding response OmpR family regulator